MKSVLEHAINKKLDNPKAAEELARDCVVELCNVIGGQVLYIPLGRTIELAIRNQEIFEEWKSGDPVANIAKRHRISSQTTYDIIAKERQSRRQEK
ncbi:hypothetical protein PSEUDO8Z_100043 [Pseudomonas sp. 8Z]|nr:hypothetical protein PSEUDO8Z_100043 [Pseudomonas sp. 8Z]